MVSDCIANSSKEGLLNSCKINCVLSSSLAFCLKNQQLDLEDRQNRSRLYTYPTLSAMHLLALQHMHTIWSYLLFQHNLGCLEFLFKRDLWTDQSLKTNLLVRESSSFPCLFLYLGEGSYMCYSIYVEVRGCGGLDEMLSIILGIWTLPSINCLGHVLAHR